MRDQRPIVYVDQTRTVVVNIDRVVRSVSGQRALKMIKQLRKVERR